MRAIAALVLVGGLAAVGYTQPPGGQRGGKAADPAAAADRFLAQFDAQKTGKVAKAKVTDERLKSLFDRADADTDGVVTREELIALFTKEDGQRGGGGPPGGPGGRGGMMGGPPPVGQVLPAMIQDELKLSDAQRKQLAELQKSVDEKLAAILTADQKKKLDEMKTRGPGGRGGRPGGPPGGPPPGERP